MFIDMHVHPAFFEPICDDPDRVEYRHQSLAIYKNSVAPLEHVFNQMNCAGIDKLCLLAQDERSISGRTVVNNREIAHLVSLHPERFIGFASVDPFVENCVEELDYAFAELHLSGLKLDPSKHHYYPHDDRLRPIYDLCMRHNKPIIFHSGLSWETGSLAKFSRPVEFEEIAASYPDLRLCLAHLGWPWVRECAMLMVKYRNVYADTAILYFDSAKEFFTRLFTQELSLTWVERSLRHQVMFGSDNPRFEQIRMAKALEDVGFREDTLDCIRGLNAIEFINGGACDDL